MESLICIRDLTKVKKYHAFTFGIINRFLHNIEIENTPEENRSMVSRNKYYTWDSVNRTRDVIICLRQTQK